MLRTKMAHFVVYFRCAQMIRLALGVIAGAIQIAHLAQEEFMDLGKLETASSDLDFSCVPSCSGVLPAVVPRAGPG
jgi:hypothetical protein